MGLLSHTEPAWALHYSTVSHRAQLLHYLPTSMQSHSITSPKWIPLQVLHEDTLGDKSRPTGCSIRRKSFDLLRAERNMQHYNWRPADELLTDSQRALHPAPSFKGTARTQMKHASFCLLSKTKGKCTGCSFTYINGTWCFKKNTKPDFWSHSTTLCEEHFFLLISNHTYEKKKNPFYLITFNDFLTAILSPFLKLESFCLHLL